MTESRRVRDLDHDDDLSIEIQPLPRKEPITPTSLSSSPGHLPSWEDKTFPAPFWLVDQAVSPVNWCNLSCGREEQGEAGSIMLKNHNPGRILFASQDPLRPFRLAARTLGAADQCPRPEGILLSCHANIRGSCRITATSVCPMLLFVLHFNCPDSRQCTGNVASNGTSKAACGSSFSRRLDLHETFT